MEQRFEFYSKVIYSAIAIALMLLTFALVVMAVWTLVAGTLAGKGDTFRVLESVGLIIVSVAIFDVGKFLIEEEVMRDRELRSIREARRSLTQFMTIPRPRLTVHLAKISRRFYLVEKFHVERILNRVIASSIRLRWDDDPTIPNSLVGYPNQSASRPRDPISQ